jgi:hypothetical protein
MRSCAYCRLFTRNTWGAGQPRRIPKLSAILKPGTLPKFHKTLVDGKYRRLSSSSGRPRKPGPQGPSAQLIAAIAEMKRRNPKFGCVRIAQQISRAFGLDIDKDVVRRVLAQRYRPDDSGGNGPSWLTFIAQSKDSLWSVDLLRCESILLRGYVSTDHDPLFRFHRRSGKPRPACATLDLHGWREHCRGLFQTPIAA